ncbi:MAG TPA: cellulase family glycosylhydrolase [Chitinispirillaceae bacterium]|nr:cellulase family glycosylhydrolase [Chitinispirillaceae bacterium]
MATAFRDYDRHLLFASTNEPGVKDAAAMDILNSFHQIFIDTVRSTGGNNASRTLVIQGPNTALEDTYKLMTKLPTDKIADRIMAEVHYYPYPFCLMSKDADWGKASYYWGKKYKSTTDTDRNSYFGEESYTDSVFNLMKMQFADKNIPVLLGEFGAMKRLTLTGDSLKRHILSRRYFYEYVASSSKKHGIIPVAWDAGFKGDGTMTMFDRKTGGFYDIGIVNAMRYGWGMTKLPGDTSLFEIVAPGNKSIKLLYSSKDSLQGNVQLPVVKSNISNYDSIIVRAFINGETKYDSAGITKYGFMNLNLVTMSKDWTWRQASFGSVVMDDWSNYAIPIGKDTTNKDALVPADPAQIDYLAVQAFSKGYRGTIYIDWIVFKSKNGTSDTIYTFDQAAPEQYGGNVESVKLIPTGNVASDVEWKTATQKYPFALSTINRVSATRSGILRTFSVNGTISASFTLTNKGIADITIRDLQGKTLLSQKITARSGLNLLSIPTNYHGVMILQINQGNQRLSGKVVSR